MATADQPTPADLARDLRQDLQLCEQATKGPWELGWAAGGGRWFAWTTPEDRNQRITTGRGEQGKNNAAFCAAAREGWPASLRRAMAVEAGILDLIREISSPDVAVWAATLPALGQLEFLRTRLLGTLAMHEGAHEAAEQLRARVAELEPRNGDNR